MITRNMSFANDNYNMYLSELLNYPVVHRCAELGLLIDRCSIKDLQDFFPLLVQSVFGNVPGGNQLGWGLRTLTNETNPHEFEVLYSFFIPMGPMFRLCYRLLNEPIKFDVPIEMLPSKTCDMLFSGRYSQFYADMIQVDPTVRQITSLSLNAFDYFILHFALHGMQPLHRIHPAALVVHNERRQTIYVFLSADYMCSFLPSHPDAVVMPSNICGTVKMSSVMTPIQTIQPAYSPKYLKMSALTHTYNSGSSANPSSPGANANHSSHSPSGSPTGAQSSAHLRGNPNAEAPLRSYSWRTESVLYLFIDTWLRYDIDANRELPSSEFIRCVRILIKQLHAFANSAELDRSPMFQLRQIAQPMVNAHTYTFLRSLIKRWPLDSSFSVVLELWLSYIQPWRYSFERLSAMAQTNGAAATLDTQPIQRRFQYFIKENMVSYTQILVQLLPRFERLDLSSLKNAQMMHRLLKVFAQTNLSELLRSNEFDVYATKSFLSSSSPKTPKPGGRPALASEWSSYRSESMLHDEDNYVCMFGEEVQQQIQHICEKMLITKQVELDRCAFMEEEKRQRHPGIMRYFKWLLVNDEDLVYKQTLSDCRKIPEIIDRMLQQMSGIFELDLPDPAIIESMRADVSWDVNQSHDMDVSFTDFGGRSNRSINNSMTRIKDNEYTVDPAQVPTKSNEMTFMVRFLYQLSTKLNLMYHHEMNAAWHRNDLSGRMARQILHPPMVVHHFDKSQGISVVCEQRLTPRLNLRFLASYQTLAVIIGSFVFGQLMFGVPSFGFLLLLLVTLVYLFVMALVNDPKK